MKCPYCNAENDENAVYCGECGEKIKIDTKEQPVQDDLWTENMTFSWKPEENPQYQNPQYQNPVPPVQNMYQDPYVTQNYNRQVPKKNNTLLYVILGICIVAVIGLAGVVGMNVLSTKKADSDTVQNAGAKDEEDQSEKDTGEDMEEETEEPTEAPEEEEIEYLDGVDAANVADFNNNLSTDSYIRMSGEDSTLSFAYPKDFFCSNTEEENDYTFYSGDGLVMLRYWKEEVGNDGKSVLTSEFSSKKSQLNTSGTDDNGVERFSGIAMDWSDKEIPHYVLGGRYTTDLNKGYYSVASLRGGAIYHMEFEYPVDYNNGFANPVNYMIDCLYRYCGFSGSSKAPRSYQEFQAAN